MSELVADYALRLHAAAGDRHHVVSPLGAWLLLAVAAPLATGRTHEELERVLGCDVDSARRVAEALLRRPHPALSLAFGAWCRGGIGTALEAWGCALPSSAFLGPMPTQAQADAWARDRTNGQVGSMPVAISDDTRLLLASAVATEVPWARPFDLVLASELGGPWAARVKHVMRRRQGGPVNVVASTAAAGLVGVSDERGHGGLHVVSVIAAPEVPPARVIAAAYDVAAHLARRPSTAVFVPAFDLPLTGHAWNVRERKRDIKLFSPRRVENSEVTIPAWTADTELRDLVASPGTGFAEIAKAVLELLPPDPRGDGASAAQAATARFDTNGFSAAAVTVMDGFAMAIDPQPRQAIERTVEVRFDRPFAVVAATNAYELLRDVGELQHGLPAFGAWVTEPMEPSERNETWRREAMQRFPR